MRRRTTARFWLMMIAATLVVLAFSFGLIERRYAQIQRRYEEISARRDGLILQVQKLEKDLKYTQTDEFIMKAARDQGLILPSEIRYVNSN